MTPISFSHARWRGVTRILPRGLRFASARSRVRKRLKYLFGRPIGGFAPGRFSIEGRSLLFVESDPSGEACHLLVGFCQASVQRVNLKDSGTWFRVLCQGRGDALCRWEVMETTS